MENDDRDEEKFDPFTATQGELEEGERSFREAVEAGNGLKWLDMYAKLDMAISKSELAQSIRADTGIPKHARELLARIVEGSKKLPVRTPKDRFSYRARKAVATLQWESKTKGRSENALRVEVGKRFGMLEGAMLEAQYGRRGQKDEAVAENGQATVKTE